MRSSRLVPMMVLMRLFQKELCSIPIIVWLSKLLRMPLTLKGTNAVV